MEGIRFILNRMREDKALMEKHVTHGGSIEDFAQYRFLVGQIRGVEHSIKIIEQFIKEANSYESDI